MSRRIVGTSTWVEWTQVDSTAPLMAQQLLPPNAGDGASLKAPTELRGHHQSRTIGGR